jgi:hypothetical protein
MRTQRLLLMLALVACALAACPAVSTRLAAAERHARTGPLSAKLIGPETIAGAPLVDALLDLGQREHVPMGIEYLGHRALTSPISVRIPAGPLGRALSLILSRAPGYTWSERYGAIVISHDPLPAGTAALLAAVISAFAGLPKDTLDDVAGGLEMRVYFALHPKARGWGGSYIGSPHPVVLGRALHLRDATVREILSRAVSGRNAAWVVLVAPRTVAAIPNSTLWRFLPYTNPPTRYSELLRGWGVGQKVPAPVPNPPRQPH